MLNQKHKRFHPPSPALTYALQLTVATWNAFNSLEKVNTDITGFHIGEN
jgi:hypothetical protein